MARRGLRGALRGRRLRFPLRPRPRYVLEIMTGTLIADAGDVANVFLSAYFAWALKAYPLVLALLPGLANLRGGNMSAMAARISTKLQLGVEEPRLRSALASESGPALSASIVAGVMIAVIAALASGVPLLRSIAAAGLSSAIVLTVMIPFTALVAVWTYRRGVNPDNVAAPILTVAGDIVSVPSLVAAVLVLDSPRVEGVLAFATLWAAATALLVAARLGGRLGSIVRDISIAMLLTAFIESLAGGILSRARDALYAAGVIHVVASLLEDTGAASSVIVSRSSTMLHLYGPERVVRETPSMVSEAVLGVAPALTVLAVIAGLWGRFLGLPVTAYRLAVTVVGGGLAVTAAGSAIGVATALATSRLNLDPDNAALPLITSIVDLIGSAVTAALALVLVR